MMLLEIKELSKEYQRGTRRFVAVSDVSLSLKTGDFLRIEGRSGSGKSTLLNMIIGLLKPTSGRVFFNGIDIFSLNDSDLSALRNGCIGYIPQGASLLSNLTVLDNVRLPWFLADRQGDPTDRAYELLERVGLPNYHLQYPAHLSGGEMRRVAIARAMINQPVLLIADEPTSDLDIETTGEILGQMKDLQKQGATVLMVTHEKYSAALGNRLCTMAGGRLKEIPLAYERNQSGQVKGR